MAQLKGELDHKIPKSNGSAARCGVVEDGRTFSDSKSHCPEGLKPQIRRYLDHLRDALADPASAKISEKLRELLEQEEMRQAA